MSININMGQVCCEFIRARVTYLGVHWSYVVTKHTAYPTTYSLWSAMHELSLLLNYQVYS